MPEIYTKRTTCPSISNCPEGYFDVLWTSSRLTEAMVALIFVISSYIRGLLRFIRCHMLVDLFT